MSNAGFIRTVAENVGINEADATFAVEFVDHYYRDPRGADLSLDSFTNHIKTIQTSIGLLPTGNLDTNFIKAIKYTPRCGVSDHIKLITGPSANKWGRKSLMYFIDKYVGGLSIQDQDDLIYIALSQWAEVADLKFSRTRKESEAQLVISTGSGKADKFDGPSNTLAWAYLPPTSAYDGQLLMKFDLDETWIRNSNDRGTLFLNVACHEFGHMLGLDHSRSKSALMAPYYAHGITKPQQVDDIPRIQSLYGKPSGNPIPPSPAPPNPNPDNKHKVEITVADLNSIRINGKAVSDFALITPRQN